MVLWMGVNSDKDNIHPILNQLIPAGHCSCQSATIFKCDSCLDDQATEYLKADFRQSFDNTNQGLNDTQCWYLFPGLFEDILRARKFWSTHNGIQRHDMDGIQLFDGMARAAIFQGNLYVIQVQAKGDDHRRKVIGILSSIYRVMNAVNQNNVFHDTEFIFSVEDKSGRYLVIGTAASALGIGAESY